MKSKDCDPREGLETRTVAPVVLLPRAGLSGGAIAIGCGALAISLFLVLDANRRALSAPVPDRSASRSTIASPPALAIPQPPAVEQTQLLAPSPLEPRGETDFVGFPYEPIPAPDEPIAPPAQPAQPMPVPRPSASDPKILLIDLGGSSAGATPGNDAPAPDATLAEGHDQAVRATIIRNRSSLVPQGTLIAAVLETPIDSSRPGLVRAVVSRDVRGFDGTHVLIPRGSRLIGEARGDAQPGQKRVLVTWTRLIRPDGVAIRIGSPGADNLGGAGLKGRVNTHFAERFANAVLQSALAIGVNLTSRPGNGSVVVGMPAQVGSSVAQVPIFNTPPGPTIRVSQGAEISIFVARDLDFGAAAPRP